MTLSGPYQSGFENKIVGKGILFHEFPKSEPESVLHKIRFFLIHYKERERERKGEKRDD